MLLVLVVKTVVPPPMLVLADVPSLMLAVLLTLRPSLVMPTPRHSLQLQKPGK